MVSNEELARKMDDIEKRMFYVLILIVLEIGIMTMIQIIFSRIYNIL